jgi:PhnB protein
MGAVNHGNALDIGRDIDIRAEADPIFGTLAEGGTIDHEQREIFSGDYFGSLIDTFGTTWIVSCTAKPETRPSLGNDRFQHSWVTL